MNASLTHARHWLKQVLSFSKSLPEAREHAQTLLDVTADEPIDDPRPEDPAELAQKVAAELRKPSCGLHAFVLPAQEPTAVYIPRTGRNGDWPELWWCPYSMTNHDFENLGPVGIANEIQRQESKRAREWAGDK